MVDESVTIFTYVNQIRAQLREEFGRPFRIATPKFARHSIIIIECKPSRRQSPNKFPRVIITTYLKRLPNAKVNALDMTIVAHISKAKMTETRLNLGDPKVYEKAVDFIKLIFPTDQGRII